MLGIELELAMCKASTLTSVISIQPPKLDVLMEVSNSILMRKEVRGWPYPFFQPPLSWVSRNHMETELCMSLDVRVAQYKAGVTC